MKNIQELNNYTQHMQHTCMINNNISPRLYDEYGVNLGLRDENGVMTGLTNISKIVSSKILNGQKIPSDGMLWYRGYKVEDLIASLGESEM